MVKSVLLIQKTILFNIITTEVYRNSVEINLKDSMQIILLFNLFSILLNIYNHDFVN